MKAQELKVGDSFEVVEVLDNIAYEELKGRQGISVKYEEYRNGIMFMDFHPDIDEPAYLYYSEIKPIGKLTITKVK